MQELAVAGIILAAGKGTRMKSDLPKGLHQVCGLPMAEHVGRALKAAGVTRPVVVVGFQGELLKAALGESYDFVWQHEQLGTGHAAMMASELMASYDGPVIVAAGDTPMIESATLAALVRAHRDAGALVTVATSIVPDPQGYGRIVRNGDGEFLRIVEQKDATPREREIREVNAALYCFDSKTLFRLLPTIRNSNSQGEYYLTDIAEAVLKEGGRVIAEIFDDPAILAGVNDRWQLAQLDLELRRRVVRKHAVNGVTVRDIDSIYIGMDVEIGVDTVLEPNTILIGATKIGRNCHVGPFTRLENCTLEDTARVTASCAEGAYVSSGAVVGPYAHLRPGARLGPDSRVGNFCEVKNADLASGVKVSHLSYIGDAKIGPDTNVGAGTITCNFDGVHKHETRMGANVFVGSHSTLVAPVEIGDGAIVAAGSVITGPVPADAMAFGRARQENKEGRAEAWRNAKREAKKRS